MSVRIGVFEMNDTMTQIIDKYKWLILYGLFGVGTLVVNISVYGFSARYLHMSTFRSNMVAWFVSVMFSYFVNHKWVFENTSSDIYGIIRECISFIGCRIMTGIIDILLMVFLVDYIHMYDMAAKIIVNVIVIIINLFACTNIVFKAEETKEKISELY